MGSTWITVYTEGPNPEVNFREAVAAAKQEYGHGGYTGTIAEKSSYEVITGQPVDLSEAYEIAREMVDTDDERVTDTWGPAGAIPVKDPDGDPRPGVPDGWLFVGWASE
jgi:hypothetical protein